MKKINDSREHELSQFPSSMPIFNQIFTILPNVHHSFIIKEFRHCTVIEYDTFVWHIFPVLSATLFQKGILRSKKRIKFNKRSQYIENDPEKGIFSENDIFHHKINFCNFNSRSVKWHSVYHFLIHDINIYFQVLFTRASGLQMLFWNSSPFKRKIGKTFATIRRKRNEKKWKKKLKNISWIDIPTGFFTLLMLQTKIPNACITLPTIRKFITINTIRLTIQWEIFSFYS